MNDSPVKCKLTILFKLIYKKVNNNSFTDSKSVTLICQLSDYSLYLVNLYYCYLFLIYM